MGFYVYEMCSQINETILAISYDLMAPHNVEYKLMNEYNVLHISVYFCEVANHFVAARKI